MKTMWRLKVAGAVAVLCLVAAAERTGITVLEQAGPKCARYCVRSKGDEDLSKVVTNRNEIVELSVSDQVEEVPPGLFANMPNLRTVTIERNVKIGARAFANCPKLSCVHDRGLDLMTLPADAFEGCAKDCVCVHCAWERKTDVVRPLYGWACEYWISMSGYVQGVWRTEEAFYGRSQKDFKLLHHRGDKELLELPETVDGWKVTGLELSAIPADGKVRTLVLPATCTDKSEWRTGWPGTGTNGVSTVRLVICRGVIPRSVVPPDGEQGPLLCAYVPSDRKDVVWVPRTISPQMLHEGPVTVGETEDLTYCAVGDVAWVTSAKRPKELVSIPETIDGKRVISVMPTVLKGRTPRTLRLPKMQNGSWLLDPEIAGESVRDLRARYVDGKRKDSGQTVWLEDVSQADCDRWLDLKRFSGWKLLDAKGDYVGALRAIEKAAAAGEADAKIALESYLVHGRPGLYDIIDPDLAEQVRNNPQKLNGWQVFMIDSNGYPLPDWRNEMSPEERIFWLRYRAVRGDGDARRHLNEVGRKYHPLPTLGVYTDDAPARTVALDEAVGYDLAAGDYCGDLGRGKEAHLKVACTRIEGRPCVRYEWQDADDSRTRTMIYDGRYLMEENGGGDLEASSAEIRDMSISGKRIWLQRPRRTPGVWGPTARRLYGDMTQADESATFVLDPKTFNYAGVVCEPPKPEVGKTAGFGRPGKIEPYDADAALTKRCADFGFAPLWYEREAMDRSDPRYWEYAKRLKKGRSGEETCCREATVSRIACLFSDASTDGLTNALPLVVYFAGSGEQGTDLRKMFNQSAVFRTVRDPAFQAKHPCHLLAIMPPHFANVNAHYGNPKGKHRDLQQLYADLIFDLDRELKAKGRQPILIDRTALVGLGSGGTAAVALAHDYPERYAGACAMLNSPMVERPDAKHPGRWWYGTPADWGIEEDNTKACNYRAAGAVFKQTFYDESKQGFWWDGPFTSDEFRSWMAECFEKGPVVSDVKEAEATAEPVNPPVKEKRISLEPDLVLVKTEPNEAVYCGTAAEVAAGAKVPAGERIRTLDGITHLTINRGVKEVPAWAFAYSPDLRTVKIGLEVKSIGTKAFYSSRKLSLVDVLGYRQVGIAQDAFGGCSDDLSAMTWDKKIGCEDLTEDIPCAPLTRIVHMPFTTYGQLYRSEGYIWRTYKDKAELFMYMGKARTLIIPEMIGNRAVTDVMSSVLPDCENP